jgi:hypothetical protein
LAFDDLVADGADSDEDSDEIVRYWFGSQGPLLNSG